MAMLLARWRTVVEFGTALRVMSHSLESHHLLLIFTPKLAEATGRIARI